MSAARCERCGRTRREVRHSHAARAQVCVSCHLRSAPLIEGTDQDLLGLAAELRGDADELARVGDRLDSPQLSGIAAKLGHIPLLLEVGYERKTPERLVADAGRLRAAALSVLEARR